jgi:chromosome segregation ATPase
MDVNQLARMIEWLDEERRRDKAVIAALEERIQQQQDTISQLNRRVNGIESDQTTLRGSFLPAGRDVEVMEQLRQEMQQLMEQNETKRLAAERETERRAALSRDSLVRPVREMGERVDKLERALEQLPAVRAEQDRLSGMLPVVQQRLEDLNKKQEEPDRRMAFLEEQRRADSRRVSELQSELPEMQKQVDSIRPKLELLEEMALRNEKRVLEVQGGERERRDQIQQFIDQQSLLIQQRDQQLESLEGKIGNYDDEMRTYIQRFETWSEAYRSMKRIIDDFERIGDRLERRINEVAEMQRLSEDRFRQEWNAWTADDQKRWKQFTLTNDEAWRSHDKEFENYVKQITDLAEQLVPVKDSLERLWRMERARFSLYREQYQSLLDEYDTQVPGIVKSADNGGNNSL